MDPKWFPSHDRPFISANPLLGSAYAIGLSSLLLPPSPARSLLPVPPILWFCYQARTHSTGSFPQDYLLAIHLPWLLIRWSDLVIFRTPERDLFRIKDDGTYETAQDVAQLTLLEKMKRNVSLFTTFRGVGWNWLVKNVDPVPDNVSPMHFTIQNLLLVGRAYLGMDFASYFLRNWTNKHPDMPDFFGSPFQDQVALAWAVAVRSAYELAFPFYLAAAVCVGIGLSKPRQWPPINGKISGCYTVRKVWGYGWHQFLRRPFEVTGAGLASILKLKRGSLLSQYFKLYWAFFFSACIHHVASMNVPYTSGVPYQFMFFMMQPFAITFEDMMMHLGRKMGLTESWKTKAIGFCWTVTWLSYSLRYAARALFSYQTVYERHPALVFSVADRVFG